MSLLSNLREKRKEKVATAIPAIPATQARGGAATVARIATVAVANPKEEKTAPTAKVGAGDTVEPFDREAFEERAAICEFDGGLSRADAEALAWREDDRRRCTQCLNRRPHDGVCKVAEPKVDAVVVANRSYAPDPVLPRRCEGYTPKVGDPDQRPGAERWSGLMQKGGE